MAFSTLPHTSLAQTPFALQHLFKVKTHPKKTKKKTKTKKYHIVPCSLNWAPADSVAG